MADTRYREQGYSAKFNETEYGAFLDIYKDGKIVCGIGVGFFNGGADARARVMVERFAPNELRGIDTVDEFDDDIEEQRPARSAARKKPSRSNVRRPVAKRRRSR